MSAGLLHTFLRGGIAVDDHKGATAHVPIEQFIPREVTIPLQQHLGPAATPTVQRKTVVRRGDLIGEAAPNGAPVHASVSGTVLRVALQPHPTLVEAPAVVIQTAPDGETMPSIEERPAWAELPREAMIEAIAAAGIVGLGGAAFPTYRKLRVPTDCPIDTLVINGAECEPYLTSDRRLMAEQAEAILWGAQLLGRILNVQRILIGVEDNAGEAIEALSLAITRGGPWQPRAALGLCHARYPQGSEKQLIEALTRRVVPAGKLPMHVGIVVQNVATALACYRAIRFGEPLMDRVLTVSGGGILQPKNLSVPIGTLISDIIDHCGGLHSKVAKVIAGGPMMGRTLGRLDVPVIKGTGGLIFLRVDELPAPGYGPCISCARCLDACPLGLEPNQISIYTEAGRALETEPYGTKDCFECGCCAYVCPAARPLVQFIQTAKSALQTGSALGIGVRAYQ